MSLAQKNFGDLITFTRASGGGRFNASGQFEWLASNAPRFNYDPVTLQPRGILIEEQRTNLLTYSADQGNSVWNKSEVSVSSSAVLGPDGNACKKITENTANVAHAVTQASASVFADNTQYTATAYLKAGERSIVWLESRSKSSTFPIAWFDLAAGTVLGTGQGATAQITHMGNGWYRCSITANSGTGGLTGNLSFGPAIANGSRIYTGDGSSGFYIWATQLEAGAFPTSYIPTTTAQVTRAADIASVSTLSPWYRADEGTLYVEGSAQQSVQAGNGCLANIGTASEYSALVQQTATQINGASRLSGATQASFLLNNNPAVNVKAAMAFKKDDFAMAAGGILATPDTSGNLFNGTGAALRIGNFGGTANFANGHIRSIRYYSKRLTNAELQALTA